MTLTLQASAFGKSSEVIMQSENVGAEPAVKLSALRVGGKGFGKLRFEGFLLNMPGSQTGGCRVDSDLMHAGLGGQKAYAVSVSRNAKQCCIGVMPIGGMRL